MLIGNLQKNCVSVVAVLLLLILPSTGAWNGAEPRASGPDWAVADIWYESTGNISCKVVNIEYPFSSIFFLNLSVEGKMRDQKMVTWISIEKEKNITFDGIYAGKTPTLTVSVEIYDPQHMLMDVNRSNDQRKEFWEFGLPDLWVRSIYRDPSTLSSKAIIGNRGEPTIEVPFNLSFYLNTKLQWNIHVKDPLPGFSELAVDLGWTWDRVLSPIEVGVWVDSNASVPELDELDNNFSIIWRAREALAFTGSPAATYIGTSNATLSWAVNMPCSFEVRHGRDREMRTYVTIQGPSEQGSLELANLLPSSLYMFKVKASDQYGRSMESGIISFITDAPQATGQTTGAFDTVRMANVSGRMRIPFTAQSINGIMRIDYFVDGKYIGSEGGASKTETHGMYFDAGRFSLGEHTMMARVTTAAGAVTDFTSTFGRTRGPFHEFPKVNFTASPSLPRRGTEMMYARCTDPNGMVNATWEVDGEVVEVDEPWHPESTYFGPTFYWDTTEYSEGEHIVTIRVANHDGNVTSVSRRLEVDNILPPPDPDVWVRREHIEREGSTCTVILNITNHGRGDAYDILIRDNIKGFVPLDGEEGTAPLDLESVEWEVVLTHPLLRRGETAFLEYRCVPIIYGEEEWELGYMRPRPGVPGEEYTTQLNFERSDHMIIFQTFVGIPAHNFEEGYTTYGGARKAISTSNYVMLTNPERLRNSMAFPDGFHEFIAQVGELVALKTGVFMFVADPHLGILTNSDIFNLLNDWEYLLNVGYEFSGYLAILGEDEIIPTWRFPDTRGTDDVSGSDQGYANLDGGDESKLIVGRILGDTPEELLVPVWASINVHTGYYGFDPNGKALIMSGTGNGVRAFYDSAESLAEAIDPLMDECVFIHRSDYVVMASTPFTFDGDCRHFGVGDVNNDWDVEFVKLDTAADRVTMKNSLFGTVTTFDTATSSDYTNLLVGNVNARAGDEIIKIDGPFSHLATYDVTIFNELGMEVSDFTLDHGDLRDGKALGNFDGDVYEELVIADSAGAKIRIFDMDGTQIDDFNTAGLRDDQRLGVGDFDADGDVDIALADHYEDRIRVYRNPSWTYIDVTVGGLDREDGFSVGEYSYDGTAREEAVVIDHDTGDIIKCGFKWNGDTSAWEQSCVTIHLSDIRSPCAAVVTEASDDGGYQEIVVAAAGSDDTVYVMDVEQSWEGFKDACMDEIWNSDLVVYRDHANQGGWSGFADSNDAPDFHFLTMHNAPVMVGLACQSGRFHDSADSFAQACMRNGAGVFIGATEVSSRTENNLATSFVKSFVRGTPIGRAFKNWEALFIRDHSDMGIDEENALYWVREYNLYGDPAFGSSASALPTPPVSIIVGGSRASYDHDLTVPEPTFGNDTVGSMVLIEGGYHLGVIGEAVVPYVSYEFMVPSEYVVSSAFLTMTGSWSFYEGLILPPYEGPQIAGEERAHRSVQTRAVEEIDPDDRWYPPSTLEWEVLDGGSGNSTFVARVFPFQYDMEGRVGRFCPDWRLTVDVGGAPVVMEELAGPKGTITPGSPASFSFYLDPLYENATVSVSQRIENETGVVAKELSSSVMDLIGATGFEETWDTTGAPVGLYYYFVEINTPEGAFVKSYRLPVRVGSASVDVAALTLSTGSFKNGTVVYANTTYTNTGDVPLIGSFQIALYSPAMNRTGGINGTIDLGLGQSVSKGAVFNMTGLPDDIYTVISSFFSFQATASKAMVLSRAGTLPPPPLDYEVLLNYSISNTNITEGAGIWVNGTVERSDDKPFGAVPVAVWIEGMNRSGACLTDTNGTFSLLLENLSYGNWTVGIRTLVGDREESGEEALRVNRKVIPPDDDDVDDDIDDDVDDDDIDDDTDDDVDDDADDDDGKWLGATCLIGAITAVLLLIVVICVIIVIALRNRRKEEEE